MEWVTLPRSFYNGDCFDAYRYLGAHPHTQNGQEGWCFTLWAPHAKEVLLCGEFNGWNGQPMENHGGVWCAFVPDLPEGTLYKYHIHGADDSWVMHSDPYGFSAELRPGTASKLARLDFTFTDERWLAQRTKCRHEALNIYEMHAGSWKMPHGEWPNYEELAGLLIPWLLSHHYTHVELLPLAEHPFDGSWGYQTTGYFSATSRYGTPAQLAAFVDSCHRAGIGVLIDFVPVHFASNWDALAHFDGTALYEYDSDVGHSEWGTCNFNYYEGPVRSFLASAAAMWMDVYHFDGIRMDAISRAIYWMGDPNRGVNEGAVKFLQNLNHGLNARWPTGIYVAEDSTNFVKVTAPTRYDGLGFDYKWDMGWMHDTLDYFATPFDQRKDHYHKLTFSMMYFYNELYLLALSHDEVVHGKKTIIDKLWGTYEEKTAQLRTLYFYMYTHPGKKLNFMGNELAHFREWDEAKELDWFLLKYPFHDAFQKYMARLGSIYTSEPALYEDEYDSTCFEWVACESLDQGLYAYLRRSRRGSTLLCVMNTQWFKAEKFPLYLRKPCKATLLLNTEATQWGGAEDVAPTLRTIQGGVYGKDYTLQVDIPPMGACIYRIDEEPSAPKNLK